MKNRTGSLAGRLLCAAILVTPVADAAVLTPLTLITSGPAPLAPLVLSADGVQAFAGSSTGDLEVISRDTTGNYSFDHTVTAASILGSAGTKIVQSLAVYGDYLYVGYESGSANTATIAVLQRSGTALNLIDSVSRTGSILLSGLAVSPDGIQLYAVDQNSLYVYNRDDATGKLSLRQQLIDNTNGVDGLGGAWAVAVSGDNHYIYVSGADDKAVAVFRRDAGNQLAFVAVYRDATGSVSGLDNPRGLVLSPDGRQLYVAAAGSSAVTVFNRDTATGQLQFYKSYQDGAPGFDGLKGALALAVSPEGSQLYALGSGEDALTVMRRDNVSGDLTQVAVLRQGQGTPTVQGLSTPWAIAATPDGKQVLVTSPVDNSVAGFRVAAADLDLVMTPDVNAVNVGDTVHFQLTVTNSSTDNTTASGVIVTQMLPPGSASASGSFGGGSCTVQTTQLTCRLGNLSPGVHADISVSVSFQAAGQFYNEAVVAADQRDPFPANNRDHETINVATSANRPPVAEPDRATTLPGVAVDIPVLTNDHDPDSGDVLSLKSVPTTSPHGTLSIKPGGIVHYAPAAGFHGTDTFTYTVTDNAAANPLTAEGTVTVIVNTPPVANDDIASVTAGTTAAILVLVNDTDADGDSLTVSAVQSPSDKGGTVSINDDGSVNYTSANGFTGQDSFTYTVSDGYGGTATAHVNVTVSAASPQGTTGGQPGGSKPEVAQEGGGGALGLGEILSLVLLMPALRRREHAARPD